ncbi:MAG: mechanosensitive ion channel, partial [Gemmatimonadaceae bacterium]|nr:mechanosensitive ion channel [Gemmatimonadaceae bacterium]
MTGLLLMLLAPAEAGLGEAGAQELPDTVSIIRDIAVDSLQASDSLTTGADTASIRADTLVRAAGAEARRTIRGLWYSFLGALPKFLVAIGTLFLAWLIVRLVRPLLQRVLGHWERASAATAIFGIIVWLLAVGIAVSVLAGDIRALVGSLGLVGLALSWALQTPIESFTGWLMNNFQGYYRVGDRVAVGDALGDVYRIDFLTTTVWEIGSMARPGFVNAEQPTGRLITFPNSEVLSGSLVNLTRDFPYVWDEVSVQVANTSDIAYAVSVLEGVAMQV